MSFDVATVVTALLAGVGGSGVTAIALTAAGRHTDERELRNRKADRLRAAFAPMLLNASVWVQILHQQKYLLSETREQRDQRLQALYESATRRLEDARIAVELEPGVGVQMEDAFQRTWGAYVAYQSLLQQREELLREGNVRDAPRHRELREIETRVNDRVEDLRAEMVQILTELETPLPRPWWTRLRRKREP